MFVYKHCVLVALSVALVQNLAVVTGNAGTVFRDDFNGAMSPAWQIVRNDPAYYAVQSTYLDLRANYGELGDTWANNAKNLFLIPTPATGDLVITMRVRQLLLDGAYHAPQVNILAYDDDDNLVRSIYGRIYGSTVIELGNDIAGNWSTHWTPCDFGTNPFYLRLTKVGNVYTQYYSTNGLEFTQSDNPPLIYGNGSPGTVGFAAFVDPLESSHAYIDFFEVASGSQPGPVPEPLTATGVFLSVSSLALYMRKRLYQVGQAKTSP